MELSKIMLAAARKAALDAFDATDAPTPINPTLAQITALIDSDAFGCNTDAVRDLTEHILTIATGTPVALPRGENGDFVGRLLYHTQEGDVFAVDQHDGDGQVFGRTASGQERNPYSRHYRTATKEEATAFFDAAEGDAFWKTRDGMKTLAALVGTDD